MFPVASCDLQAPAAAAPGPLGHLGAATAIPVDSLVPSAYSFSCLLFAPRDAWLPFTVTFCDELTRWGAILRTALSICTGGQLQILIQEAERKFRGQAKVRCHVPGQRMQRAEVGSLAR